MEVVSVNVGTPREIEVRGHTVRTSIWKHPVLGRVAVAGVNLAGDDQSDRRVHGGPDKAVYAYAVEDYEWWAAELSRPLAPAMFGENITTRAVDVTNARVGDHWSIGSAQFEVVQPRFPCYKLGIRMGDATFVERFEAAARPGAYLRIIGEGSIEAGDTITITPSADATAHTMREIVEARRSRQ